MVNRPAGGARSIKHPREPYDWYCEDQPPVRQLFERISFADPGGPPDMIWDPSCGRGNILDVAKQFGHPTVGSDIIDRHPRHTFQRGNFLLRGKPPLCPGRALSIVNNPPYSYIEGIAESFIRKALEYPIRRAAFLLPIAFLASAERWRFFDREFRPSHIAILSERPSMPPGSTVTAATEFKGGMADYVWIIYTAGNGHRWRTETIFLKPDSR